MKQRFATEPSLREHFYGVDFSGARLAGQAIWIAHAVKSNSGRLALRSLQRLDRLAGTADRDMALAELVRRVQETTDAVWGLDFPFGMPIEIFPDEHTWADQFEFVASFGADAVACGHECVRRARALKTPVADRTAFHVRRLTDMEARTPFDTFHYRIIRQTFFGIRHVLEPIRHDRETAVLPFQYEKWNSAERIVVETCPSSVLKRLGLPHQLYKQPEGGPLTTVRKNRRREIVVGLSELIDIDDSQRLVIMRNAGGDALDAVLAAVGTCDAMGRVDHDAIQGHARYPREGYVYF